jgi:hypothetical protein
MLNAVSNVSTKTFTRPLSKIETFGNTFYPKVANKYFLFKLNNQQYLLV